MVSLCSRADGTLCFIVIVSFFGASSKKVRQSSSESDSPLSGDSFSSASLIGFGFGGFAPSPSTHHVLSSEESVGKVFNCSSIDSKLAGTLVLDSGEWVPRIDLTLKIYESIKHKYCCDNLRCFSQEKPSDVIMHAEPCINKRVFNVGVNFPIVLGAAALDSLGWRACKETGNDFFEVGDMELGLRRGRRLCGRCREVFQQREQYLYA
jgi:hypothetical protein